MLLSPILSLIPLPFCLNSPCTTVFPQMYMYMFVQRKKHLNPSKPRPVQTEGIQFPTDDKVP